MIFKERDFKGWKEVGFAQGSGVSGCRGGEGAPGPAAHNQALNCRIFGRMLRDAATQRRLLV
ncbi:hypothetical protein BCR33DRAFT_128666 [Rhizoclosmatium globosum]|uniref:Uncharacterized protein n=1 Tax=Rhizoclosmatium globosum TaxID=329046 RepID=A0A1Y2CHY7_9FUNG|nr:hypothetical protein BCR33DRAFT_128666 [Rhizoclosmatium globosum]|eukprot:ORY46444.1 hypothetical protein BCR33DRAFT_128666 [Rhizoclosmatium globosum]